MFMGALIVLVIVPRTVPEPEKSERNPKYIETVYEPRVHAVEGERTTVPWPSRRLAPLDSP